MSVHVPMTLESEGWTDTGPAPDPVVMPEARWYPREELERAAEAASQPAA